jgi:hypothetical protein
MRCAGVDHDLVGLGAVLATIRGAHKRGPWALSVTV